MVNLHKLKKNRVCVGKLLVKARNERAPRKWIHALEDACENLNHKIKELRKKNKVKRK